jgi:F-type H+-transporting ATPase subunit gamma
MPTTRDIRRRIKSVKNTGQITKAMQMVAASKMRRAQQAALAGRPYANMLKRVLGEVARNAGELARNFLLGREVRKRAVILVSPDRGLCGSLNSNLFREAARMDKAETVFVTAGKRGSQYVSRTKRALAAEFAYQDVAKFHEARAIAKFAANLYNTEKVDQVDMLFTFFESTLSQKPIIRTLLPVGDLSVIGASQEEASSLAGYMKGATEFTFEPSSSAVLEAMIPHYLNYEVYQVLLEARASEHSARMVAMKNATDNANQLIKDLTLQYNKTRQAIITNEILEIATAGMAMQ